MVTLACFRKRRKPSSSGRRIRRAWPLPLMPLAVLPTLWMYSCRWKVKLKKESQLGLGTETEYQYGTSFQMTGTYGTESEYKFRCHLNVLIELFSLWCSETDVRSVITICHSTNVASLSQRLRDDSWVRSVLINAAVQDTVSRSLRPPKKQTSAESYNKQPFLQS